MDIVQVIGVEELRVLCEPLIELGGACSQVPGHEAFVKGLRGAGELACLPHGHIGVADGAGVAAKILQVRLRQHVGDSKGNPPNAEPQGRPVRDLRKDVPGDGKLRLGRCFVALDRQRTVDAFDHIVRIGDVDAVGAVHARDHRIVLIYLEYHRLCDGHDGLKAVVRRAQGAVPLAVRLRYRDHGHVHPVVLPVQERHLPEQHGHETDLPFCLLLSLVSPDVPAVPRKRLMLRIRLQYLDLRGVHQAAPDLHIRKFAGAPRKGPVKKLRKTRTEAEVHPVTGLHDLRGLFRRHKLLHVFLIHPRPPECSFLYYIP